MKTTACILLLAAAAWAQQVAVPQGGSLGPSSKLSDGTSLSADKVDGRHSSETPAANTVPSADSNGKLAPGWLPPPTPSSLGGVFMDADCLLGNHVSGIDAASGRLECSADGGDWSNISNKPAAYPPDTASAAWQDLLGALALKAPLTETALSGATTAEQITVAGFVQVGGGTPAVTLSYLTAADSNPAGACSGGAELLKATSDGSTKRFYCNAGTWTEDVPATSALGDPGASGVLKRTTQNATAVARYSDIVGMWTGCTAGYLKYDGSCSNISGPGSKTAAASQFLNAYDSGTGEFSAARPTWADVDKTGSSLADLSTRGFAQLTGTAAANQLPKPTTSAIGGVYSDADCAAGQHFNGIDTTTGKLKCAGDSGGGLADPGANGLLKRTALNTTAAAGRADVIALWNGCASGYLKQDGSCDTPAGTESTPALSEPASGGDAGKVVSSKPVKASGGVEDASSSDQSLDLPTAVSPAGSVSGHGKFSFQGNKMMVSENGGAYAEVGKASQIPTTYSAIVGMWTACTAGYLKYDGTCSSSSGGLGDPGANGIMKRTALNTTAAAARADVLALWTACTSGYLKQDGTCDTPSGSESTPALSENSSNVNSSKPISIAGTQAKIEVTEGTPIVAASGKGALSFGSSDHRPYYSYNGGAAAKLPLSVADVVGMWTSCTAGYLKYDGTCATPSGTESTPALSEDATNVTSSKPVIITSTAAKALVVGGAASAGDSQSAMTVIADSGTMSAWALKDSHTGGHTFWFHPGAAGITGQLGIYDLTASRYDLLFTTAGVAKFPQGVNTISLTGVTDTTAVTNLNADMVDGAHLDTSGTLAANSDTKIPSQKAVKTYTDTKLAALSSFPAALLVRQAQIVLFGSGTAGVLQDTDDVLSAWSNNYGTTWKVSAIAVCRDGAGGTNPTVMVSKANGGADLLTGNITVAGTCSSDTYTAGTLVADSGANRTIPDGGGVDIKIVAAGGTATEVHVKLVGSLQ